MTRDELVRRVAVVLDNGCNHIADEMDAAEDVIDMLAELDALRGVGDET